MISTDPDFPSKASAASKLVIFWGSNYARETERETERERERKLSTKLICSQ